MLDHPATSPAAGKACTMASMENALLEQLPITAALSDADAAAVTKFTIVQLRAHTAGVCVRELGELRRDCAAELAAAVDDARRIQESRLYRSRDAIQGDIGELARKVDRETLTRFVNQQDETDAARVAAQRLQAHRHVEILKLRVALIDAEVGRAQATSQPLFQTRDALKRYLITAGVLRDDEC
jgi:hypothetical protein